MFKFEIPHDTNIEFSNAYFDDFCKDHQNIVNNKEWTDLNMDDVFLKICSAHTTPGEHILYKILRTPLQNRTDLRQREACINKLSTSQENKEKLIKILKTLNYQDYGNILAILKGNLPTKNVKLKQKVYFFLGVILPISLLAAGLLINPGFFLLIALIIFINTLIHYKIENYLDDESASLSYLGRILATANSISNLDCPEIKNHIIKLKQLEEKNKKILKNFIFLKFIDNFNDSNDLSFMASIFFLLRERAYYKSVDIINKNIFYIKESYETIGEIDALISISEYRNSLQDEFCSPEFIFDETLLEANNLRNPLIDNCVSNNIIFNNGVILTGSNMAGKSTFLRTLGINIILSRTICTCLASSFKSSFFNLYTSITPEDDILEGKSYYMAEAEGLHRIVTGLNSDVPTFCIIDEIFKGTNPIERVAAATEILNYLGSKNTITVVATHDKELTDLVNSKYSCYYFSEDVNEETGLSFDYKIKKGISPSSNAIKLLKYLNYPDCIIDGAINRVKMYNLECINTDKVH